MKESYSLYEEAQIFLAGVRLFQHREERLPSLKELADFTRFSVESVHHLCNRLEKLGAVARIRGAFDDRVSLEDPLKVETLREQEESPDMEDDIKKWKEQRENTVREVEKKLSPDAGKKEREDFFAEIEEKLQKGGKEDRKSPLDDIFRKDLGDKKSSARDGPTGK
jgi:DNA-binding MarR family transcriptional regulator